MTKYLDPFQLIGFTFSLIVAVGLLIAGQDTLLSFLVGLVLATLTQLFDLQARVIRNQQESEETAETIIRSLDGVVIKEFSSSEEHLEYAMKRISEAKRSIDDITIGVAVPDRSMLELERYERLVEIAIQVCQKNLVAYPIPSPKLA